MATTECTPDLLNLPVKPIRTGPTFGVKDGAFVMPIEVDVTREVHADHRRRIENSDILPEIKELMFQNQWVNNFLVWDWGCWNILTDMLVPVRWKLCQERLV